MLRDERRERRDVGGIGYSRDDRHMVGVVERRGQAVEVGGDGGGPGFRERGDDVDALPRAGEENSGHSPKGSRAGCRTRR